MNFMFHEEVYLCILKFYTTKKGIEFLGIEIQKEKYPLGIIF